MKHMKCWKITLPSKACMAVDNTIIWSFHFNRCILVQVVWSDSFCLVASGFDAVRFAGTR